MPGAQLQPRPPLPTRPCPILHAPHCAPAAVQPPIRVSARGLCVGGGSGGSGLSQEAGSPPSPPSPRPRSQVPTRQTGALIRPRGGGISAGGGRGRGVDGADGHTPPTPRSLPGYKPTEQVSGGAATLAGRLACAPNRCGVTLQPASGTGQASERRSGSKVRHPWHARV